MSKARVIEGVEDPARPKFALREDYAARRNGRTVSVNVLPEA